MKAMDALLQSLQNSVAPSDGRAAVADEARLKTRLDGLVYEAVFGDGETKAAARWLIWEIAQALGIRPASIREMSRMSLMSASRWRLFESTRAKLRRCVGASSPYVPCSSMFV